jgi:hypothetical protein
MTVHRMLHWVVACSLPVLSINGPGAIALAEGWTGTLPVEAEAVGDFRLCESDHTGNSELYSCRDFSGREGRFRLFYRGGPHPKAIATSGHGGVVTEPQRLDGLGGRCEDCDVAPPRGVPGGATHLGTGVCQDEDGDSVPCSIFRHAPSRDPRIHHYVVFYYVDGKGPYLIEKQAMGTSSNAMVAELAYQVGRSLLRTGCCKRLAIAYIAHAYELFPNEDEYRSDYLRQQTRSAQRDGGCSPGMIGSR